MLGDLIRKLVWHKELRQALRNCSGVLAIAGACLVLPGVHSWVTAAWGAGMIFVIGALGLAGSRLRPATGNC